ncbi:MAG: archaeosortase A [Thermoplasmatota archaeon]
MAVIVLADGWFDVMMAVSILLLGAGFAIRRREAHLVRIAGWVLFAAYWPFQSAHFFDQGDPFNGWFSLLGPVALLYFVYHEWLSWKWNEDPKALRWLAGTTSVAAATFFIFTWIPVISTGTEYWVGVQTQWLLAGLFGLPSTTVVSTDPSTHEQIVSICLNATCDSANSYAVSIILACTAIQSMMIFIGAIAMLDAPLDRKIRGYILTVPLIHGLNLFRNAGIVYGYKILQWNPFNWGGPDPGGWRSWFWDGSLQGDGLAQGSFEWMHAWVGKWGSLFALVLIALAVFALLPELHGYILDLFDLPKRRKPGFFRERDEEEVTMAPRSVPEAEHAG